jgi:threonine aldolase
MVSTIINSQPKSFTNLCFTGTNWAKELKEEKTPSLDLAGDNLTHTVLEKDPFGKITYPYIDAITVATKKNRYGYGKDDITELASKKMREIFGLNTIFCPMLTGSAANVTILAALINPTEKILCSDMAHINCMESNFYSLVTGTHSLQVPSKDGKIIFEELEKKLNDYVSESSTR